MYTVLKLYYTLLYIGVELWILEMLPFDEVNIEKSFSIGLCFPDHKVTTEHDKLRLKHQLTSLINIFTQPALDESQEREW